jgi:hypothetical protein
VPGATKNGPLDALSSPGVALFRDDALLCYAPAMRLAALALVLNLVVALCAGAESPTPEAILKSYLGALKDGDYPTAYSLISKAMRQGKDQEAWIEETKSFMAFADVKIFDYTVYPGKIDGDTAKVPNILESQDRFVNALGLTEHELYTLVREDGVWKVDAQLLLEPGEVAKWFPTKPPEEAAK